MFTGLIRHLGTVTAIDATQPDHIQTIAARSFPVLPVGASVAVDGVCLTVIACHENALVGDTADGADSRAMGADSLAIEADSLAMEADNRAMEAEISQAEHKQENVTETVFAVQTSPETRACTKQWQVGSRVHLEPAMTASNPLDGHFVLGHVDGTATLLARDSIAPKAAEASVPSEDAEQHPLTPYAAARQQFDTLASQVFRFRLGDPDLTQFVSRKGSIAVDGVSLTVNAIEGAVFSVNLIPQTLAKTFLNRLEVGDPVNIEVDVFARYAVAAVKSLSAKIDELEQIHGEDLSDSALAEERGYP
ncbi:MAG: riboflavin synthase [Alphaproteobacteria bacterium]|nr:riboflavin synthase [Alphaproteobacteria bacterium]